MADLLYPVGGCSLPRQICSYNWICPNKRISTLMGVGMHSECPLDPPMLRSKLDKMIYFNDIYFKSSQNSRKCRLLHNVLAFSNGKYISEGT